ncbi:MAG: hypothetical protein OEM91_15765, partial [Hyphomicrobiales bacterium]|nr:hypothetical protein [Hyphomicrobiales bacterium]
NKIGDLKTATKQLVDVLIPDTPTGQKVRIGYAPFAAGINAGSYAGAVSGGVPAPDDCVYERLNINYQDTDNFPAGRSVFKTLSTLPSAMKCPDAKILPLTDDKSLLKSTVDAYSAKGCTAGHLGTSWAWNILSPAWAPIWPAASKPDPYNNGKTKKVAILMTDGEYNTVAGAGCNSAVSVVSSNHAKETCTAMKAKGIVVYTVGFMLNKASAKAVMSHCATDSGKAYEAQNGAQLIGAFKDIAESINRLRLSS